MQVATQDTTMFGDFVNGEGGAQTPMDTTPNLGPCVFINVQSLLDLPHLPNIGAVLS